ncbi:hypothetical protein ACMA5I_02895 [Paracoccaceae bacterium GXU_MW_L88]
MDRDELTWIVAGGIFAAIVLGWILHWIYSMLAHPHRKEAQTAELATRLHDAEEALTEARQQAQKLEADMNFRLGQKQAEYDAAMEALEEARLQTSRLLGELQQRR